MKEIIKECRKVWPFIKDRGNSFVVYYGDYSVEVNYSKKYKLFYFNGRFYGMTKPSFLSFEVLMKALKFKFNPYFNEYYPKIQRLQGYNVYFIKDIIFI